MPSEHRRKRVLRPSIIVTFAAGAAALAACGPRAISRCPDTDPTCNPQPTGCPDTAPSAGSPCALNAELSCNYPDTQCPGGGGDETAICDSARGTWQTFRATCNPPPPVCPTAAPTHGTACRSEIVGQSCGYGDCYGSPTTRASCDAATLRWQVSEQSCNPPPPVCPVSEPVVGTPCQLPVGVEACTYGDCYGTPTAYASCDPATARWEVSRAPCNPPPPPVDAGIAPSADAGLPEDV